MDAASMARGFISLQKQSFNNFIDAMAIFQDQTERANRLLADQMGINEKTQEFADQWRTVVRKSRDDFRKQINESYTRMEEFYAGLALKKASKKQEQPSKR